MEQFIKKLKEEIKTKISSDKHSEFGRGFNLACCEILDEIDKLEEEYCGESN